MALSNFDTNDETQLRESIAMDRLMELRQYQGHPAYAAMFAFLKALEETYFDHLVAAPEIMEMKKKQGAVKQLMRLREAIGNKEAPNTLPQV